MKRTIEEVIDLIKQKRQSAINAIERLPKCRTIRKESLANTIDTYTDVLALLETSHLTEEQKAQDRQETAYTSLDALEELKGFALTEFDDDGNEIDCKTLYEIKKEEIEVIERDLKVNNILKEKKVDLSIINWLLAEQFKQTPVEKKVSFYNFKMNYKKGEMLNEEEMTLIVECLKAYEETKRGKQ